MRSLIATSLTVCLLGGAGTAFAGNPTGFPSALPPVSNPGECYAQIKIPAQYSTGTETVLKADGFAGLDVTEPQFQSRTETVMTKEPSTRYIVRQRPKMAEIVVVRAVKFGVSWKNPAPR